MDKSEGESSDTEILNEIQELTDKISSRNLCSVRDLEKYADRLGKYENIKNQYESGNLFDISPLAKFSSQAVLLSNYIDKLILQYDRLDNINTTTHLLKVKESLTNIDDFFSKLEYLHHLMKNKHNSRWYTKLTKEISIVDNSLRSTIDLIDILNDNEMYSEHKLLSMHDNVCINDSNIFPDKITYSTDSQSLSDNIENMDNLSDNELISLNSNYELVSVVDYNISPKYNEELISQDIDVIPDNETVSPTNVDIYYICIFLAIIIVVLLILIISSKRIVIHPLLI